MNEIEVVEYYDGEVQFLLEVGGAYFYGVCVGIDFDQVSDGRSFVIIPISAEDKEEIVHAVASDNVARLNDVLHKVLAGRAAALYVGPVESWDPKTASFNLNTSAYRSFLRFPLIDALAGLDK